MLFIVVGEHKMKAVRQDLPERSGCTIGGHDILNVRYADDTTFLAISNNEMEAINAADKGCQD